MIAVSTPSLVGRARGVRPVLGLGGEGHANTDDNACATVDSGNGTLAKRCRREPSGFCADWVLRLMKAAFYTGRQMLNLVP